jgi:hypothetical protein
MGAFEVTGLGGFTNLRFAGTLVRMGDDGREAVVNFERRGTQQMTDARGRERTGKSLAVLLGNPPDARGFFR